MTDRIGFIGLGNIGKPYMTFCNQAVRNSPIEEQR